MISIDSKKCVYEFDGDMIEVISDIGYAIFNVTVGMATVSDLSWDEAFEQLMNSLTRAVKSAREEAQNYDTFS